MKLGVKNPLFLLLDLPTHGMAWHVASNLNVGVKQSVFGSYLHKHKVKSSRAISGLNIFGLNIFDLIASPEIDEVAKG
jgi:hypothetical protein